MKKIELHGIRGRGKYALVDDENFEYLNQLKWHLNDSGYAVRRVLTSEGRRTIRMHRLINKTPEHLYTDHINHNRLDNRKSNLRNVTNIDNCQNRISRGYIYFRKNRNRWTGSIRSYGKDFRIGHFGSEHEARMAMDNLILEKGI